MSVEHYTLQSQHHDFRLAITYNNISSLKNVIYWLFLCCLYSQNNYPKEYTERPEKCLANQAAFAAFYQSLKGAL